MPTPDLTTHVVRVCEHLLPGGFVACDCESVVYTECSACGWLVFDPTGTRSAEYVHHIHEHTCP